jgi:hypothetical protein
MLVSNPDCLAIERPLMGVSQGQTFARFHQDIFMRFLLLGMNCCKERLIVGKQCHTRAIFTVGSLPAFAA